MFSKIKIGDAEVGMLANAASPYIYKQVFHEDFLTKVQEANPDTDLFQKMGFIFAKQAETENLSDLMKLSLESFFEWLSKFDVFDVIFATSEIANLYYRQKEGTSSPKPQGE